MFETSVAQTDTDRIRDAALDWHEQLQLSPIPRLYHDRLVAYFVRRGNPGSFLRAVLENKLRESVRKLNPLDRDRFVSIVEWLEAHAPIDSWGSEDAVQTWLTPAHHLGEGR